MSLIGSLFDIQTTTLGQDLDMTSSFLREGHQHFRRMETQLSALSIKGRELAETILGAPIAPMSEDHFCIGLQTMGWFFLYSIFRKTYYQH